MVAQEEAKELLAKAWNSMWTLDLSTMDEFFAEDIEISGFNPPKQTTWKGIEAMRAHCKELQPVVTSIGFNIKNLDVVTDGNSFYATWEDQFQVKIPGQEHVMEQRGIVHVVLKGGKIGTWTMYEDPTPFVAMAMQGQMGPPPA